MPEASGKFRVHELTGYDSDVMAKADFILADFTRAIAEIFGF